MEFAFLPVLAVLALLIIVIKRLGDVKGSVGFMQQSLSVMERELRLLKEQLQSRPPEPVSKPKPEPETNQERFMPPGAPRHAAPEPTEMPPAQFVPPAVKPDPVITPAPVSATPPVIPPVMPPVEAMAAFTATPQDAPQPAVQPAVPPAAKTPAAPINLKSFIAEPQASWLQQWLSRNPDLEKFIGENLINKIGIAILVLGIAFFVKYAIDQEWINEIGRVSIGLFCGAILIGLAHRLRRNYRPFSSVLAGGGITVLYFTIAFAFHQYHLFSQPVAFVIMVVITAFAIALSVLYDRLELGVLATLGGFVAPFLVSRGDGNYIALFTYLIILNAGLIALAYYKKWRVLNFIAFFFTAIIYGGWIQQRSGTPGFSYSGTFLFGTVFYIMFVVMNLLYHVVRSGKLKAFDGCILFSINLAYYGAGYYLLTAQHLTMWAGLFTAALGVFNLVFSYALFRRKTIDRNFIYLLIGLTLSFVSLACPVQLSGNYITLFWSAEMVALLWLYQKSGIQLVKIASAIITVLTGVSLLMDWGHLFQTEHALPVFFNRYLLTALFTGAALLLMSRMLGASKDEDYFPAVPAAVMQQIYLLCGMSVLFIAGALEVWLQFRLRFPGQELDYIYLELYYLLFVSVLYAVFRKRPVNKVLYLAVAGVLAFYYLLNTGNIYDVVCNMLLSGKGRPHIVAHWISLVLFVRLIVQVVKIVRSQPFSERVLRAFAWVAALFSIVLLSVEVQHMYVWLTYGSPDSIERAASIYAKAGLSILWGLSSFVLIWMGLRYKFKPLRILALGLFGVTILKLFFFDLRNISQGGKIAAFILLGAILLTVSFMYQRLKKIIIDDKPAEEKAE